MKILSAIALTVLALNAQAWVGPDLTPGTDVKYFTKLRFDTAQKEGYTSLWKTARERQKVQDAYRAGKMDEVQTLADAWLKRVPIDADIHLMVAMSYKEKGDLPNMCKHLNIFYGLLGSITSSGDGLSAKTAFAVVSPQEAYSLVQEIGGRVKSQSLQGNVDVLEVERRNGKTVTLYFDVSVHLKALAKEFQKD